MNVPGRGTGHNRGAAAVTAVLGGLLLAACGGTGGTGGPSGTAATTPGSSASPGTSLPPVTSASPRATQATPAAIMISSPAFAPGTMIPARFSCRGGNTPPPLKWRGMPAGTAGIALVMDDPDAPGGTYTHWVVFNLPATATGITGGRFPAGSAQALNSGGQAVYLGPCPPRGTHHYRFTVYAERRRLPLPERASLPVALHAIKANALAEGRLTGLFSGG